MDTMTCVRGLACIGVLAAILPGVSALSDIAPTIAAAAVALFLLLVIVVAIVWAVSSNTFIKGSMNRDGKVKMPRWYFDKKKEVKRRLLAESVKSSRSTQDTYVTRQITTSPRPLMNGSVPPVVPVADKESMVRGWNQDTRKIYEEKGYTMELGNEQDDEFVIETTLVDNEVLDVGPYRKLGSTTAKPVDGNVYTKPYLYSSTNRGVTVTKSADGVVSNVTNEMTELRSQRGQSTKSAFGIEDNIIRL